MWTYIFVGLVIAIVIAAIYLLWKPGVPEDIQKLIDGKKIFIDGEYYKLPGVVMYYGDIKIPDTSNKANINAIVNKYKNNSPRAIGYSYFISSNAFAPKFLTTAANDINKMPVELRPNPDIVSYILRDSDGEALIRKFIK